MSWFDLGVLLATFAVIFPAELTCAMTKARLASGSTKVRKFTQTSVPQPRHTTSFSTARTA